MSDTAAPMDGGKKRSPWMTHVKKTMKANEGKSLMQVLKMAKKTYKKMAKKTYKKTAKRGGSVAKTALPLSGGRSKTRRGGRKH